MGHMHIYIYICVNVLVLSPTVVPVHKLDDTIEPDTELRGAQEPNATEPYGLNPTGLLGPFAQASC